MSVIYGPVPSWRLGSSLGIDLISTRNKTCTFDCLYCQLGTTTHFLNKRREFVSLTQLANELESASKIQADHITFSGTGEPTLANNLTEAIEIARSMLHIPTAVLTNSSLMCRKNIRYALAKADEVVAKLDAPSEELFTTINRPISNLHFDDVLNGIMKFRGEYKGKLALQMMFIKANMNYVSQMATIAGHISPDEIQINTPLRPCNVQPLTPDEIKNIQDKFSNLKNVFTVYDVKKYRVTPINSIETLRRRPEIYKC